MEIKTPKDLQPMDVVLRRDGKVCWILENEYTHKLQSFGHNLWGQQVICDYSDDFIYGKNRTNYQSSVLDTQYDIVAVHRPRSAWKALDIMYRYGAARDRGDRDWMREIVNEIDWIYVGKKEETV